MNEPDLPLEPTKSKKGGKKNTTKKDIDPELKTELELKKKTVQQKDCEEKKSGKTPKNGKIKNVDEQTKPKKTSKKNEQVSIVLETKVDDQFVNEFSKEQIHEDVNYKIEENEPTDEVELSEESYDYSDEVSDSSEKKSKRGRKPKQKETSDEGDKETKRRGRKPKQKDETDDKVPKKRGRKPKEKVYSVKELPKSFYEENKNETLILHLPIKLNDKASQEEPVPNKYSQQFYSIDESFIEEEPKSSSLLATQVNFLEKNMAVFDMKIKTFHDSKSFSTQDDEDLMNERIISIKERDDEIEENIGNDCKNKYFTDRDDFKINKVLKKNLKNIMYEFIHSNSEKIWPESTNIHCYWCCHPFGNTPTCLPEYFKKGKFYVSGCFCSFNCAASYNFSKNDEDIWERYSLLNLMYKKMYNQNFIRIPLAPPREVLKNFGGYLSIDEFRENLMKMDKLFNVVKPPLVAIIPKIEENILSVKNQKAGPPVINQTILNKTQSQLKLKRSKPVTNPNNTLQSFMDLKIIS